MAAVVLDLAPTMPARLDRRTDAPESLRLPLCVVQQAVMARMEPSWNGKAGGNLDSYPVPESHAKLREVNTEEDVPLREVIEEERATRLESADALGNPGFAPNQVFIIRLKVVAVFAVFLPEVERRVGEDSINDSVFDVRQDRHAVRREQCSERGGVNGIKLRFALQA